TKSRTLSMTAISSPAWLSRLKRQPNIGLKMSRQTGVPSSGPVQPKTDDFSHDLGLSRRNRKRHCRYDPENLKSKCWRSRETSLRVFQGLLRLSCRFRRQRRTMTARDAKRLHSRAWWDNPDNPGMTAQYLERFLNYGLTREELQGGRPIIGIAQTGSDLVPCNRHNLELASRVRDGIRDAGGIPFEFPVHPLQETGIRPTAALHRNLAYLGVVEILYCYPLDGVVLLTGCDKTT